MELRKRKTDEPKPKTSPKQRKTAENKTKQSKATQKTKAEEAVVPTTQEKVASPETSPKKKPGRKPKSQADKEKKPEIKPTKAKQTKKAKSSEEEEEEEVPKEPIDISNVEFILSNEQTIPLSSFKGEKNVIVYFYPKDNTPGCTTQANLFRDNYDEIKSHDAIIIGVSKDSLQSHAKFKEKQIIPYDLASDVNLSVAKAFRVVSGEKVTRSTFVIDKNGNVVKEWRKVKVKEHVGQVLEVLKEIEKVE